MAQKQSSHDWEKTFVLMLAVVGGMAVLGGIVSLFRGLEDGLDTAESVQSGNLFLIGAALGMMAYVRKSPNARAAKYLSYAGVVIIWAVVGMMIMLVLAG